MTINPVEMQIIVPQAGQVNRLQRAHENQQQTEQQILGQLIQLEMKQQEHAIQRTDAVLQKKVSNENAENEERKKEDKERKKEHAKEKEKEIPVEKDKQSGHTSGEHIDIRV